MHFQFSLKEGSGPILEELNEDEDASVTSEIDPSVVEELLEFDVEELLSFFVNFNLSGGNKILCCLIDLD